MKKIVLAHNPKSKLNNTHLVAAFLLPISLFAANSSETTLVVAILIPAEARVIPNVYTDITKVNTPTASSPIEFDIYTWKYVVIICNTTELNNRINVLNINNFILFMKNIPFLVVCWGRSLFLLGMVPFSLK